MRTAGTVAYTPAQIRTAYGINNLSLDGTGQTIAIVDAYDDPTSTSPSTPSTPSSGLTTPDRRSTRSMARRRRS